MGFLLLAAFISVPLIEIALFIQVGGFIGLWPTIAVVVLTAMAGTALLRHQGLGALARLQASLDRGEPPIDPVFDGFCLLAAGMLLLTPGFFTDGIGFLLFIPLLRKALKGQLAKHIKVRGGAETAGASFHWQSSTRTSQHSRTPDIIDGEYRDVTGHGDPSQLSDDADPKS